MPMVASASPFRAIRPTPSASRASRPPQRAERGVRRRRGDAPPTIRADAAVCTRAVSPPMPHSPLTNLSPLDGRYADKLDALRPLLSEHGLMHRRVQVEVEWFIALSDAGMAEFTPLAAAARQR